MCTFHSISCQQNATNEQQHSPLSAAPKDTCIYTKHAESWRHNAIKIMWAERKRMAYTPLIVFDKMPSALLLVKNESATRTESLKHRYSWALVMWALLQGYIHPNTTVYEASSGNTARSEAYMCTLIGVKFITVLPDTTELIKVERIQQAGGLVHKIPMGNLLHAARDLAALDPNGFFINQFGNSEKAQEYHESGTYDLGSVNLFHEILTQMRAQKIPSPPTHFIFSAATGGTISSVGRYVKKYGLATEMVLADTEFSGYYDLVVSGRFANGSEDPQPLWVPPGMAGTGFGWAGPFIPDQTISLVPEVIDRALKIPDLASVAAMHIFRDQYAITGGPSTGVNFAAVMKLIGTGMKEATTNVPSSPLVFATLLADNGANYRSTYYNQTWIERAFARHGGLRSFHCWKTVLEQFLKRTIGSSGAAVAGATTSPPTDPIEFGARECVNKR